MFLLSPCQAQQVIYNNLEDLLAQKGDTVTTLSVAKRTLNNLYMSNGADYRIESEGNSGLSKFIKNRAYAVLMDNDLYINCKFIRYERYRLGNWYAAAKQINGVIYFAAQPVGQRASSKIKPEGTTKLGGAVGDAIAASGRVYDRVYYYINTETGRAELVTSETMYSLLTDKPQLMEEYKQEESESADVIEKYLSAIH